jgi:hypothetical protein
MRRFALVGFSLGHSFSVDYFQRKFPEERIRDAADELVEMPDVTTLPKLISRSPDLYGLNPAIPLKSRVIPFLDKLDPVAENIGVVNCIRIDRACWPQPVLLEYETCLHVWICVSRVDSGSTPAASTNAKNSNLYTNCVPNADIVQGRSERYQSEQFTL